MSRMVSKITDYLGKRVLVKNWVTNELIEKNIVELSQDKKFIKLSCGLWESIEEYSDKGRLRIIANLGENPCELVEEKEYHGGVNDEIGHYGHYGKNVEPEPMVVDNSGLIEKDPESLYLGKKLKGIIVHFLLQIKLIELSKLYKPANSITAEETQKNTNYSCELFEKELLGWHNKQLIEELEKLVEGLPKELNVMDDSEETKTLEDIEACSRYNHAINKCREVIRKRIEQLKGGEK